MLLLLREIDSTTCHDIGGCCNFGCQRRSSFFRLKVDEAVCEGDTIEMAGGIISRETRLMLKPLEKPRFGL